MEVAIIGTGYVGLATGVALAYLGHSVTCIDTDEVKIERLRCGEVPIYEPWLAELMEIARGNLRFSTRYADAVPVADVVIITVGTPTMLNGSPDLCHVRAAAQGVGEYLGASSTVVVTKSTVPIGSGNWVEAVVSDAFRLRNGNRPTGQFAVASNPEFLREGSALHDALYPDRIVIGFDQPWVLPILRALYEPVLEQRFPAPAFLPRPASLETVPLVTIGRASADRARSRSDDGAGVRGRSVVDHELIEGADDPGVLPFFATDLTSAELIKYAANAFLALKISFINEIAELAERVGADVTEVAKGIGLDPRIASSFLQAGVGWGGSCFGKDTAALLATGRDYHLSMPIMEAVRVVNYRQRQRVVDKLLTELKLLRGRTVGLLGLAFKPHTDDLRDAAALDIACQLIERGAKVLAHDPSALERARRDYAELGIEYCDEPEQVAHEADALVLVTEWPQYEELNWELLAKTMRTKLILDGRNVLDRECLERAGFRYLGMGR